ncbi:unnamed protein product, partial [Musa hybrid cultivar]
MYKSNPPGCGFRVKQLQSKEPPSMAAKKGRTNEGSYKMAAQAEAEAASSEHGGEGAEDDLLARDGEAHVVVEAELLLGLPQQALELRVGEVRYGHDEPAPALAHVHREVALGHVHRLLLPPQARAPLQYLLDARGLRQLVVRPPNRHLLTAVTCKFQIQGI